MGFLSDKMRKSIAQAEFEAQCKEAYDQRIGALVECVDTINKYINGTFSCTLSTPTTQGTGEAETLLTLSYDSARGDASAPLVLAVQKNGTIWPRDAEGKPAGRTLRDELSLWAAFGKIAEWSSSVIPQDQAELLAYALNEFEETYAAREYGIAPSGSRSAAPFRPG